MDVPIEVHNLDLPLRSDIKIKNAFSKFLKKSFDYRSKFLQSSYEVAFDGYSFMGQKDSLNQYDSDMLHSFVLSDFQEIDQFPKEFHQFLSEEWPVVLSTVKKAELEWVKRMNQPELLEFLESKSMGYMMSCNYYPKTYKCSKVAINNTRLSAHKDVSFLTTFPFGISEGLSYFDSEGHKVALGNEKEVFSFPGYFMEVASEYKISALNHQVDLPEKLDQERFSFALFSMPRPNSIVKIGNKELRSEDYYKEYLQLF